MYNIGAYYLDHCVYCCREFGNIYSGGGLLGERESMIHIFGRDRGIRANWNDSYDWNVVVRELRQRRIG